MYINIFVIFSIISMAVCLTTYFTDKDLPTMILSAMFAIIFYITFLFDQGDDGYDDMQCES